jgi:hypothetical protein
MSDLLMHKIKKRAIARATRIDLGEPSSPEIAPPLEAEVRSRAERALGFPFPALLAALYAKIGNGGYGPGYGLLGVAGGATDDQGYDAVELYALYPAARSGRPVLGVARRAAPRLPLGLRHLRLRGLHARAVSGHRFRPQPARRRRVAVLPSAPGQLRGLARRLGRRRRSLGGTLR